MVDHMATHTLYRHLSLPTVEVAEVQTPAHTAARAYIEDRTRRGEIVRTTARQQRIILRRFADRLGERDPSSITRRDIDSHMRDRDGLRPSSRRVELGILNAFCVWLVRNGKLRRNPMVDVARPKKRRTVPAALPADAVARLLEVSEADARLHAMVWSMLGLGLRRAEVATLHIDDWDRRSGTVRVVGKGGHERVLPVIEQVDRAWRRYLADEPAASGPLFRSRKPPHDGLSIGTVGWLVGQSLRQAGIKVHAWDRVCPHALRHTALSDVMDSCGDLRVVMEMGGHRDLSTASIYQRTATVAQLRQAMSVRPY
jgi:site-specific recombinase XerC